MTALAYDVRGPDGAPWVLLGSSLGTTRDMWAAQVEPMSRHHRVVAFDTRGHGGSPAPVGPYAMAELAADVLELADHVGAERFSYVGISLGAAIGLQLSRDASGRLSRLVLCSAAARFGEPASWQERAERVRREGTGWLVEANRARWFTPELSGSSELHADRLLAGIADVPAEGYAGCCDALAGFDARPWLASITVPTRVIAGAQDPVTPAQVTGELATRIAGASLVTIDRASHLSAVERPDDLTAAVLEHLEQG
jgi:3-oxoadipate enol-lactonase